LPPAFSPSLPVASFAIAAPLRAPTAAASASSKRGR
jgi:hypothetical protein